MVEDGRCSAVLGAHLSSATAEYANPGLWEKWENAIEISASEMVQSRSFLFFSSL